MFFIIYLLIRGSLIMSKMPLDKVKRKRKMIKVFLIVISITINILLFIFTNKYITILKPAYVIPYWIWLNGFTVILLELPWSIKFTPPKPPKKKKGDDSDSDDEDEDDEGDEDDGDDEDDDKED